MGKTREGLSAASKLTLKDKEECVEIHGREDTGEIFQARGIIQATAGAREHNTFLKAFWGVAHLIPSFPLSW